MQFVQRSEILDFEEIERFVRIAVTLGINKLRVTGGEPLVRRDLPVLIRRLAAIPGIRDLALTTNGVLLPELAEPLYDAGLRRLNVHIDTLDRERFFRITRRDDLDKVLEGLAAAKRIGFSRIKLNAVAVKNLVEPDIVPLARFARENGFEVRYIEFMPLDAQNLWDRRKVLLGGRDHRDALARDLAASPDSRSRPARAGHRIRLRRWRRRGGLHRIGQPPVLPELQPHPPDRRRQAALLPVRHRGRRCERPDARRAPPTKRSRPSCDATSPASGKATKSTPRASSLRRAPCIPSGVTLVADEGVGPTDTVSSPRGMLPSPK